MVRDSDSEVPLTDLPGVTSGEVCRVVAVESTDEADFSTIYRHDFRVVSSFMLSESELRFNLERLLACRATTPFKPKKCRTDLAIRLYAATTCIGAVEVKWANNTALVLIDDHFSVPIFDANAPDALAIRRDFDERLS